ncbi:MAG: energy transducer TonB, partial [Alphaproteobacteria bacterium]|nr:energy transducer TonB [Alphaproteobacteria bacterium]
MFANPLVRLGIGVPLAAAVTLGLFFFMRWAVNRDFVEPENVTQHVLETITPSQEETEVQRRARPKPRKTAAADKPPPPPKLTANKSDVDLPTPTMGGVAPSELPDTNLNDFQIDPVAISDRDAQPIRPPLPTYPTRAAERGVEGSCDVRFDVDTRGRPY